MNASGATQIHSILPMDTLAFRLEQLHFHLADDLLYLQSHSHPAPDLNLANLPFEIVAYYYVYYSWLLLLDQVLCCALALLLLHLYSFYTKGHIGPTLFSMSCVLVYTRTDPPVPLVVPLTCSSAGLCNCKPLGCSYRPISIITSDEIT